MQVGFFLLVGKVGWHGLQNIFTQKETSILGRCGGNVLLYFFDITVLRVYRLSFVHSGYFLSNSLHDSLYGDFSFLVFKEYGIIYFLWYLESRT